MAMKDVSVLTVCGVEDFLRQNSKLFAFIHGKQVLILHPL